MSNEQGKKQTQKAKKHSPSDAQQKARTAANKAKRIAKAEQQANKKLKIFSAEQHRARYWRRQREADLRNPTAVLPIPNDPRITRLLATWKAQHNRV